MTERKDPAVVATMPCSIGCQTCSETVWEGAVDLPDPDPVTDLQAPEYPAVDGRYLLAEHAERKCRRDDCPHRRDTAHAEAVEDPRYLRARVDELVARIDELTGAAS